MSKKRDILRSLLAKAGDAGSTEAEAHEALTMAMAYAEKYGLSIEDVNAEDVSETFKSSDPQFSTHGKGFDMVDKFCTTVIAQFMNVKVWRTLDSDGDSMIVFFGNDAQVELATYIRRVIRRAMAFEWKAQKFAGLPKGVSVSEFKLSFHLGMGNGFNSRMTTRLHEQQATETGRELIVAKEARLEAEFAKLNMALGKASSGRRFQVNGEAYANGKEASNRHDFMRGVSKHGTAAIAKG